jgi:hypothetical protein
MPAGGKKFTTLRDLAAEWLRRNPGQPGKPDPMRDLMVKWASDGQPDKPDFAELAESARVIVERALNAPPLGVTWAHLRAPKPTAPPTREEVLEEMVASGEISSLPWTKIQDEVRRRCQVSPNAKGHSIRQLQRLVENIQKKRSH